MRIDNSSIGIGKSREKILCVLQPAVLLSVTFLKMGKGKLNFGIAFDLDFAVSLLLNGETSSFAA